MHSSDIRLIEHLCHACHRHSDFALLGAVFTLPFSAREELLVLLDRLVEIDTSADDGKAVFREWRAVGDEIHAWAQRHERDRSVADALTLNELAWRSAYTLEALRGLR